MAYKKMDLTLKMDQIDQ